MNPKLEALFAEFDRSIAEDAAAEAVAKSLVTAKPKVETTVVKVPKGDPNYTPENGGRVEVEVRRLAPVLPPVRRDVYEEMYWRAVNREFARPIFAEVVHAYNPFEPSRMPGYENEV